MDYLEAKTIVKKYVDAIADAESFIAHKESLLPCSKARIIIAYKVFMAHVVRYQTITKEEFNHLMTLLNLIDSFVSDDEWNLLKRLSLSNEPIEFKRYIEFSGSALMSDLHDEVVEFIQEIQKLDTADPLYPQKIYSLANIEYKPEYKNIFEGSEPSCEGYHTEDGLNESQSELSKKVFEKVFKDAISNVIFYGFGAMVIAFVGNYLGWRTMAIILVCVFAFIVLLSLVPFVISLVTGLIAIPLTVKKASGGNTEAVRMQKYLWKGTFIQLIENTICVSYVLYLYKAFF